MAQAPGSFIPKQATGHVSAKRGAKRIYIFSYVAYVIFFGTLVAVLGVFFFSLQATRQLEAQIAALEAEQATFSNAQLAQVKEFEHRLRVAEATLDQHAAPSQVFGHLESTIIEAVRLTNFTYGRDDSGRATIGFTGDAPNFDAALFQRNALASSELLAAADLVTAQYGGGGTSGFGQGNENEVVPTDTSTVVFTFNQIASVSELLYDPAAAPIRNDFGSTNTDAPTSFEDESINEDFFGTDEEFSTDEDFSTGEELLEDDGSGDL